MKWTNPSPPVEGYSFYHYILCETPFGVFRIEYKSSEQADDYCIVSLNGELLFDRYDIEDSKREVLYWMRNKSFEINKYLETLNNVY